MIFHQDKKVVLLMQPITTSWTDTVNTGISQALKEEPPEALQS